jgi:hypothetical protein
MQQEQHAYAFQLQENTIVTYAITKVFINMLPSVLNAVLLLHL